MTSVLTIPRGPQDVTPAWLGSVLGVDVDAVDVTPIGTGQTGATYRVSATYAAKTDLPATFAVKLSAQDDAVRERVALGYRSEVEYYARVADRMAIPVPPCFFSEISDDGADFVLVLADMAPAVQGDQIAGCSAEESALAVEALAGLHGPSWCDPEWMTLAGIAMPKPGDDAAAAGLGEISQMAADVVIDRLGAKITPEDQDTLCTAMSLVTEWLMVEPGRYALMHGDYRLDNMLFDPERTRITVVDWQTVGIGLPGRDLAYFTGTSLEPSLRSEIERDLVERYHRSLLEYGVADYDPETCWLDYRLGMVQVPLLVALGTAFASTTERGDDMMMAMLSRGCQAIRELETLELISSYS
ncbi:phosphotransferase family protein [Mycobacterium sp. 1274761.0]|uniref:phosphotransferase family protein n=1 Tax=Mycobacterium sp. 1274761.0 TaxID=1834077 RepID=UPI0008012147|nr:aminoglycoside phosphotransferase family protein [Mycobacterium sp. 1274761.0]OBK72155.1 aminoglycoside phosphotransferase [Mycobacterium sp. 1274761.0]